MPKSTSRRTRGAVERNSVIKATNAKMLQSKASKMLAQYEEVNRIFDAQFPQMAEELSRRRRSTQTCSPPYCCSSPSSDNSSSNQPSSPSSSGDLPPPSTWGEAPSSSMAPDHFLPVFCPWPDGVGDGTLPPMTGTMLPMALDASDYLFMSDMEGPASETFDQWLTTDGMVLEDDVLWQDFPPSCDAWWQLSAAPCESVDVVELREQAESMVGCGRGKRIDHIVTDLGRLGCRLRDHAKEQMIAAGGRVAAC
ncbi:hypothetical protein DCS_04559 [Drechmeria coniospora]|uniref:Uncharacterized protein n=1 Tax=Drechmeria coniospora TaxID=98403 RepID=A0A151GKC8_DRECN|nr:hypothetical protein DCS_04559 [Drechmeria coniospora]KYK57548.1 hypothetical protein DCS_04559 [Drechmeria coniospora]ODA79436.1 hypothetical protein RJ55_05029 [Drechmeria coniospora]